MSRFAALVLFSLALGGCASETLPEPEPRYDTPGAFIAQREGNGDLSLLRLLDRLTVENQDTLLFLSVYDVVPQSFDDARELAKRHDLPLRQGSVTAFGKLFVETEYRVVWFRTLTEEEMERLR